MVTAVEALRLGSLRLVFENAERDLAHYRNLVDLAEHELVKAERQFSSYLNTLSEKGNESTVCA
jgi:hypothetical protein